MRHPCRAAVWSSAAIVLSCVSAARAVVRTIDATAEANVTQSSATQPAESDYAYESLDETTPNLPLEAEAYLAGESGASQPSMVSAMARFTDPRLSETENPGEFGMDIAAFSLSDRSVGGSARAIETRTIVFTPEDVDAEEGTPLKVTSYFYLSGFMLIWGQLGDVVSPAATQVTIRVYQVRPGQERATVLEANVGLSHDESGQPVIDAGGAITVDNVALAEVTGVALFGQPYFLALPDMGIPYTYETQVGEEFTLEAEVQASLSASPLSGASITLGLSAEEFLASLGALVSEPVSPAASIPGVTTAKVVPAEPLPMKDTQVEVQGISLVDLGPICGRMGAEAFMIPAFLGLAALPGFRRKPASFFGSR